MKVDGGQCLFLKIMFPVEPVTVNWREGMKVEVGIYYVALNKLSV